MGLVSSNPDKWLPLDVHGARKTIDYAHHEIHAGSHYTVYLRDAAVAETSVLSVLITSPATGEMHTVVAVNASLAGAFTMSEAPNASGGSAIVAYNNNRQSTNTATLVATSNPTYVSSGTVLIAGGIGAAGNPAKVLGGAFAGRQEWILDQSTLYLLRFVSAAASNDVTIILEWYEES